MTESHGADKSGLGKGYLPLVELWTLRALMNTDGISAFVADDRFQNRSVAQLLGWTDAEPPGYSKEWAINELKCRVADLDFQAPELPSCTTLSRNIAGLADYFGLTEVERKLLHLCTVQRHHEPFTAALELVGPLTRRSACQLLSHCLDVPMQEVSTALSQQGNLCRMALLAIDDRDLYNFPLKIDMMRGLAEGLIQDQEEPLTLVSHVVVRSPVPRLSLDSFPHMGEDIAILRGLVEGAARARAPGVNVLIHGAPGTGKTEFVRALVAASGLDLFEVPCEEPGGAPRAGKQRFQSYRNAQCLLENLGNAVLMFDEIEDFFCFSSADNDGDNTASNFKAWINQALERNQVPTLWVTNHRGSIDPAHLRRFDVVLHMDVPPASVRRKLLDQQAAELALPEPWRDRLAHRAEAAPALVERAARVGLLVCGASPELVPHQVVGRVLNNTL